MIQRPKWEHLTLAGPESVHIMKDPPREVMSRKYEPVEMGDVTYMIRENPDRFSEGIERFAKGVNPMVSVSYGNNGNGNGGGSAFNKANFRQEAKNPYGILRDGAFRFPTKGGIASEDRPLNRQKHPDYTITATPTAPTDVNNNMVPKRIDKGIIKTSIHPSASYNIGYSEHPWAGNEVLDPIRHHTMHMGMSSGMTLGMADQSSRVSKGIVIKPSIAVTTGASIDGAHSISITNLDKQSMERYIKDKPVISYLSPIFNVAVQNEDASGWQIVKLADKDKLRIASRVDVGKPIDLPIGRDGMNIKMRKYQWMIHQAGPTAPATLVLQDFSQPQVSLNTYKKTPNQAVTSVLALKHMNDVPPGFAPTLTRNRPIISINTPLSYPDAFDNLNRDARLPEKLRVNDSFYDRGGIPTYERPELNPGSTLNPYKMEMNRRVNSMRDERNVSDVSEVDVSW